MRFGTHASIFLTVYRLAAARKLMDEALASVERGDIEGSLVPQASDAHMLAPLHPAEVGSAVIRTSLESLFND
ncbi:MAG TPA: hypothetical protein VFJ27_04165 [Terriglobia bacterium]|nr:hypothetical protein [Terriglobia bacterium]